jgi:hypothetical protein
LKSNKIIEFFVDKYITCDSDKLTSNLCEAPWHHHKKKLVERKIKLLIVSIFHAPLWKKDRFLN